ncbi:MAG: hypothetical protein ABIA76_00080 [Candidatus Diapherotrites archaeon]
MKILLGIHLKPEQFHELIKFLRTQNEPNTHFFYFNWAYTNGLLELLAKQKSDKMHICPINAVPSISETGFSSQWKDYEQGFEEEIKKINAGKKPEEIEAVCFGGFAGGCYKIIHEKALACLSKYFKIKKSSSFLPLIYKSTHSRTNTWKWKEAVPQKSQTKPKTCRKLL